MYQKPFLINLEVIKKKVRVFVYTGWNDKIVVLKETTRQLYFKTFIEKINSGNLIM